jgi:hypothetical protein
MESKNPSFPDGSAWAAILAAAIGCASFGLLVDLAEASKAISNLLNLYNPTGDLSGKSTISIIIWLASWALLHLIWNGKNLGSAGLVMLITVGLIVLALVMTFPPFFTLFG